MSEVIEETAEEAKKETLTGSLSAKVLHALAPMIRETQNYSHTIEFFCQQISPTRCASYLIPVEPGVILLAVTPHRLLAAHDPGGHASRVMRVYFPDELLDAARPQTVTLMGENGEGYEVEREPKADRLCLFEGFGILMAADVEKWGGTFGSWMNRDRGNVIAADSYRAEAGEVGFLSGLFTADNGEPATSADVNLALLSPFCHAAQVLGLPVRVSLRGKVIYFHSTDGGTLFGMCAPLQFKDEFDAAEHLIAKTLAL